MKKLNFIHLPVAIALAFCFTACSDNENSIAAPSTMCWDEEWTYDNLSDNNSEELMAFVTANNCHSTLACKGKTLRVRRCVDNVEFN